MICIIIFNNLPIQLYLQQYPFFSMIKINSSLQAYLFSQMKFRPEYIKAFQINKQIRSKISLGQLESYLNQNQEEVITYASTILLEALNQFPTNYKYKTLDSPIRVFLFPTKMTNLSIYEQQLKYGVISKIAEYMSFQSPKVTAHLKAQQQLLINKSTTQPFDIVDALNWIIIQRNCKSKYLVNYAFKIICTYQKQFSHNLISKQLNYLLKKIEDLEWQDMREYRSFFQYLCNNFAVTSQTPKQMVDIASRIAKFQLHVLGYDQVPNAINHVYQHFEHKLNTLDMYSLQILFEAFLYLPINYNRKIFLKIYENLLSRIKKETIYLQMLPYSKISKEQLESIMVLYFKHQFQIENAVYFINSQHSHQLFQSQTFTQEIKRHFYMEKEFKRPSSLFVNYTSIAKSLLDIYQSNPDEKHKIQTRIIQIVKVYMKYNPPVSQITEDLHICSLFNLLELDKEINLFRQKSNAYHRIFIQKIEEFMHRKHTYKFKSKKHYAQINEILVKHSYSKHPHILKLISNIITNDIDSQEVFHYQHFSNYVFIMEESNNREYFLPILQKIYQLLSKQQHACFIQFYIRFNRKSYELNEKLIERLWNQNPSFQTIGYFLTQIPYMYFKNQMGTLSKKVKEILIELQANIKEDSLHGFSINELSNILKFCLHFINNCRRFALKMMILILNMAIHNYSTKILTKEINIQVQFVVSLIRLCLLFQVKEKYIHNIAKLLFMIQESNQNNMSVALKIMELRFLIKDIVPIDRKVFDQLIVKYCWMLQKRNNFDIEKQPQTFIILLKLHVLKHTVLTKEFLNLALERLRYFITHNLISRKEIQVLLSKTITEDYIHIEEKRSVYLNEIGLICMNNGILNDSEDSEFYLYFLKLGQIIKSSQLMIRSMQCLSVIQLQAHNLITIIEYIKINSILLIPELIDRIIIDTKLNFKILQKYYLDILFVINLRSYNLPQQYKEIQDKLIVAIENQLLVMKNVKKGLPLDEKELQSFLVRVYKYLFVVIRAKRVSIRTYEIFKMNVQFISQIYNLIQYQTSVGQIRIFFVYLINLYFTVEKGSELLSWGKQNNLKLTRSFFNNKKFTWDIYPQFAETLILMEKFQKFPSSIINSQLQQALIQFGLTNKDAPSPEESDYYTFNFKINQIKVNYYIKTKGKQYILLIIPPNYLAQKGQFSGQVKLLQELFQTITNKTIISIHPNLQITSKYLQEILI